MKTVGTMTYSQLAKIVEQIRTSMPTVAQITVDEGETFLVVNSAKGKILSAVWIKPSACHVMAVPGLINVKRI